MTNGEKLRKTFPDVWNKEMSGAEWTEWFKEEYKEPTTKNDLGVDAISREKAIKWAEFYTDIYDAEVANKEIMKMLREMPSVTPIRPKGHWIWCGGSHKCSNCEEYTCFSHKVKYCPNCGSDNREVEE